MATEWWREVWSVGDGPSRTYCGIARTPEGYAVDVFEGDDCIESESFDSRLEAAYAVDLFRRRYAGDARETARPLTTQTMADAR